MCTGRAGEDNELVDAAAAAEKEERAVLHNPFHVQRGFLSTI